MLYKSVEIVNGETTEPVNFVGVHPVNWPGWVGPPDAAFAEVDDEDTEAIRSAGDELAEIVAALEDAVSENIMDTFAISAAAALPGIKATLRRWREVTN